MKILIVEDEIKTLYGIEKLITQLQGDFEVVGKARNGIEGVSLALEERPDLIMTDIRMPEMNGLEMIKTLKEQKFSCKYLILSGYADFQYAKEAMSLGSVDYLLKPITRESLDESLKKIEKLIRSEKSSISITSFSTQELFARVFLAPELNVEQVKREFESRFKEHAALHLLLVKGENRFVDSTREMIVSKFQNLESEREPLICWEHGSDSIYMLFQQEKEESIKRIVKQRITELRQLSMNNIVFCFKSFCGIENLDAAGRTVRDYSGWNLSLNVPYMIDESLIKQIYIKKFVYPSDIEQEIIHKINAGNLDMVEKDIQDFVAYLKKDTYSYLEIREALVCLTVSILYAIRRSSYGVYENISHLNLMDWIHKLLFVEHYTQIIINVLRQYKHYLEGFRRDVHPLIKKALMVIDREFKEELSVDDMANRLHVTPEYLSSLFIRELGIKFTTYCTQKKIEHAKNLLTETNIKIYEVAEESGYTDVKYFCKVFKKYTGMSPGEYRNN